MKRIDELIKKETKLEAKRNSLQAELEEAEKELASVHKLRMDAEKILSRMEAEQRKLDDLLKDQVPQRGRKKQAYTPDQPEISISADLGGSDPEDTYEMESF